jgi:hypothetical protein
MVPDATPAALITAVEVNTSLLAAAALTVCDTLDEVLPVKVLSPP